jgi:hypothetical protein
MPIVDTFPPLSHTRRTLLPLPLAAVADLPALAEEAA